MSGALPNPTREQALEWVQMSGTRRRRAAALPSARVHLVGSTLIPNRIGAKMLFHVTWAFKETGGERA